MGNKIQVCRPLRCIFAFLSNSVTDQDLDEAVTAIRNHPEFNPEFDECLDLSQAQSFTLSSSFAEPSRLWGQLLSGKARGVIVAPSNLAYGIAHAMQVYAEGDGRIIHIVRSCDEAWCWLQLDERQQSRIEPPSQFRVLPSPRLRASR